jgi:hypothetical protein
MSWRASLHYTGASVLRVHGRRLTGGPRVTHSLVVTTCSACCLRRTYIPMSWCANQAPSPASARALTNSEKSWAVRKGSSLKFTAPPWEPINLRSPLWPSPLGCFVARPRMASSTASTLGKGLEGMRTWGNEMVGWPGSSTVLVLDVGCLPETGFKYRLSSLWQRQWLAC